jgi:predicted AAA+ superfamily ATPase
MDLTGFFNFHNAVIETVSQPFHRYLYDQIDWTENGITILGERGVGKTTLLLQYALATYDPASFLYLSGDYFEMQSQGLFKVVSTYFREFNGQAVIIDEIHKYPQWKVELKNILDAYKNKKILVSGSSTIHLRQGSVHQGAAAFGTTDLERRRSIYKLEGLSFREYLNLKWNLRLEPVTLQQITQKHRELALLVVSALNTKSTKVLLEFKSYLTGGYYPYFMESSRSYMSRLIRTIDAVIDQDIASVMHINRESTAKLKKLLALIASSKPFAPNFEKISKDLEVSRPTVYRYVDYLEMSGLIRSVFRDITKATHVMTKPAKITLSNPNTLAGIRDTRIGSEATGALRETFFVSNFPAKSILVAEKGDYKVAGLTFEIAGSSKDHAQIKEVPDAYVVSDDLEVSGERGRLPLWLFGFLY